MKKILNTIIRKPPVKMWMTYEDTDDKFEILEIMYTTFEDSYQSGKKGLVEYTTTDITYITEADYHEKYIEHDENYDEIIVFDVIDGEYSR